MQLSVDSLRATGGFSGAPVKREVTWRSFRTDENGEPLEVDDEGNPITEEFTADVWVRRLSYKSAVNDVIAMSGDGDIAASRISQCIVDESGAPIFKKSDITGVHDDGTPVMCTDPDGVERPQGEMMESLGIALLSAVAEVNRLGKREPQS